MNSPIDTNIYVKDDQDLTCGLAESFICLYVSGFALFCNYFFLNSIKFYIVL